MDKKQWSTKINSALMGVDPAKTTPQELHNILGDAVMEYIAEDWTASAKKHRENRHACYFSMEFLVGRAVFNNLLVLDILDETREAFKAAGVSLDDLEEIEDAALGNGGLGRLAACFLDSAATRNLPLDGYGIRYKYGLFKQYFEDGCQKEMPDDWTAYGDAWSIRREDESVLVTYADQVVRAVPYDMPIIGCKTNHISTLRLWQAEAVHAFDFDLFNQQKYLEAMAETVYAENISRVLYPNDDTWEGKKLRLKQEYFFCSASLQSILREHKRTYGTLDNLADKLAVQLNDTHPVISIPELIRLLMLPENGYDFNAALAMAKKIFHYTNHTVMPEALEKWDCNLFEQILPEIYGILLRVQEDFIATMYQRKVPREKMERMKLIQNGTVHMAHIATYVGAHTNGVAAIHTEILKKSVLSDWYSLFPERFQNKTNGITQRRWLALCNPELSSLLTELLGSDEWVTNLDALASLDCYAYDDLVMHRFMEIKETKKEQLCAYVAQKEGIEMDASTIFDVQIKRLHEYKRQLLNAFSILYIYYGIKDGSIQDFTPMTFLFGAKSAPGYRRAKAIIRFINEVGKLIENDPKVSDKLKVVFVSNYNVSYAEKLVAAADISEQISTAGTEASGTGNMKLMLNGAVTLGTYDGANIEIVEEAGEENNYIFGATVEHLERIMPTYDSRALFASNPKIARVVSTLIDGTVSDGGTGDFRELYYALLDGASWHAPDNYYLLGDLESYVEAKLKCNRDYTHRIEFAQKQWHNLVHAGKFSADRTIADYAENIWGIESV